MKTKEVNCKVHMNKDLSWRRPIVYDKEVSFFGHVRKKTLACRKQ